MKRIVHIGFARKIRDKAKKLVAHLLEVSENGLEWEPGKFFVKDAPQKSKTIQEIAFATPPVRREGRGRVGDGQRANDGVDSR